MTSATGAQTIGPANGGKVTAVNTLGTTAAIVLNSNPFRKRLTFHNPGTQTVFVAPVINAQGAPFTPTNAALGGTFQIFPASVLVFEGEVQDAWQAFAATGSNNPLTIMESNV